MAPDEPLPPLARWDLLRRLERHLLRTSYPRIQVFLLVLLTGAVGLLTSTVLLHLQVRIMALRYVVSVAGAYGAFLVFVSLWILSQQRRWKGIVRSGGPRRANVREVEARSVKEGSFDAIDWLDLDTDLLPMVLVVAGILSIAFFVWYLISVIALAPELLAEVFLDGVLSAALSPIATNRTWTLDQDGIRSDEGSVFVGTVVLCICRGLVTTLRARGYFYRRGRRTYRPRWVMCMRSAGARFRNFRVF
jgi:hypothetical protein